MGRTLTVLDGIQEKLLVDLRDARKALDAFEAGLQARNAAERARFEATRDVALWAAREQRVPIRLLLPALGTTNPNVVYNIEARKPRDYVSDAPGRVAADWKALVSVSGSRVSAVGVPPAWWTYEVKDRRPNRPKAPWSGWVEFDPSRTYIAQTDVSPSPLQAEWLYGDGTLREAVGL